MKTVRRLLYRDMVMAVAFVALGFLGLFYFQAFTEEMERLRKGQALTQGALLAALELPNLFYEVFPIAVLIGTIFSLSRMAQSSEFTILRTGGLGPGRALKLLAAPALAFTALTFVAGDVLAPMAERWSETLRAQFSGGLVQRAGGAWMKDRLVDAQGQERLFTVHVRSASLEGRLEGIRIFHFSTDGRLRERWEAETGQVDGDGRWRLFAAQQMVWPESPSEGAWVKRGPTDAEWASHLNLGVVSAALLSAKTMSTLELFRYTRHLSEQAQSSQRYEIQFWRRAFYPLACLVMVALALPFAYLHARAGGVSAKVFGGIMLGISFVLLSNLSGHLGVLNNWTPWAVAAAPSLLYLGLSMAAFAWLVRYR
ncbi:LPS export ABC transporter permease LptG [Inhella gelatinilytica]|uniref:LPS export ABC transporter permease LptG n=1 Tax=Inhella gelatinilytica TaxID=2795030 RepID=A0A931NE33_9BURK|nr:LPS export ABC transporter permease LptG [Inhella gelatinilytica]MBH9553742.1 LPS export ABC transporter permease LptG [Inhella gelatinilytica]